MVNNNTLFFMFNLCNPKPGQGLEVGVLFTELQCQ